MSKKKTRTLATSFTELVIAKNRFCEPLISFHLIQQRSIMDSDRESTKTRSGSGMVQKFRNGRRLTPRCIPAALVASVEQAGGPLANFPPYHRDREDNFSTSRRIRTNRDDRLDEDIVVDSDDDNHDLEEEVENLQKEIYQESTKRANMDALVVAELLDHKRRLEATEGNVKNLQEGAQQQEEFNNKIQASQDVTAVDVATLTKKIDVLERLTQSNRKTSLKVKSTPSIKPRRLYATKAPPVALKICALTGRAIANKTKMPCNNCKDHSLCGNHRKMLEKQQKDAASRQDEE